MELTMTNTPPDKMAPDEPEVTPLPAPPPEVSTFANGAGATAPTRPTQDAIIDPAWGQWVHDRALGDPLGVSNPGVPVLHSRSGGSALVSDASARLTIPLPVPFPNTLIGAWATSKVEGAESRLYVWDSVASTKSSLVFLCYAIREVSGVPTLGYSPNVGQYAQWIALGS